MNRRLFHAPLYWDGMRRTALLGGLFSVLLSVQALLIVFGFHITYSAVDMPAEEITVQIVHLLRMNPLLLALPCLLVPLLMMNLFGFLNQRSQSDFWHSVPFKRSCLFLTHIAVVLSWVGIALVLSTLVSVMGTLTLSGFLTLHGMSVVSVSLSILAMSMLVAAAFSVAMSLTGTTFNNIIVTALILFLPRSLMLFFNVVSADPTLFPYQGNRGWMSNTLNQIFGLFGGLVEGGWEEMFYSASSIGYTAGLSVVYFALGMWLFCRRKSEKAGSSAVSPRLQAAFRVIVGLVVCLIPIYMIVDHWNQGRFMDSDTVFGCVVLYVVAVACYFVYEIISTKKGKNLLKAIPTLAVLALLNVAIILSAHLSYRMEFRYLPTPGQVQQVKIADGAGSGYQNDYFPAMMERIELEDPELIQQLCETYADTKQKSESGRLYQDSSFSMTVGFRQGLGWKYRTVFFTNEQYSQVLSRLGEDEAFQQVYDIDRLLEVALHKTLWTYGYILPETELETVLAAYRRDVKEMSTEEWYRIVGDPFNSHVTVSAEERYYNDIGRIRLSTTVGLTQYDILLPLNNRFPESYEMVLQQTHRAQKEDGSRTVVLGAMARSESTVHCNVELYNGKTKTAPEYYELTREQTHRLLDLLWAAQDTVPKADSRLAKISCWDNATQEQHSALLVVPDEADLTFLLGNVTS